MFSLNSYKIPSLGSCGMKTYSPSYDKYQFQNMFPWIIDNTQRYVNEQTTYGCLRWLWIHTSRGKSVQGNRWQRSWELHQEALTWCVAGKVGCSRSHSLTFTTKGYAATAQGARHRSRRTPGIKGAGSSSWGVRGWGKYIGELVDLELVCRKITTLQNIHKSNAFFLFFLSIYLSIWKRVSDTFR